MSHENFVNDTIYESNVISPEFYDQLQGLAKFELLPNQTDKGSPLKSGISKVCSDSNLLKSNGFHNLVESSTADEDTRSSLDNQLLTKVGSLQ